MGVLWLAKTRVLSRKLEEGINALVKHGIRFSVRDGEIYVCWRDLDRFEKLCREGVIPRSIC